jgi:hypothetical protein
MLALALLFGAGAVGLTAGLVGIVRVKRRIELER